jgi:hypothetical protein
MHTKTTLLYASILIIVLFSFSAIAGQSHLDQAIQHAETAATSSEGKAIVQHAQESKTHAKAAKNDKTDAKHLDEGIKCLDDAVKEGNDGNTDAAKKAATDAVKHFKQAAQ